jgi:hypothetical protein
MSDFFCDGCGNRRDSTVRSIQFVTSVAQAGGDRATQRNGNKMGVGKEKTTDEENRNTMSCPKLLVLTAREL